LKREEIENLKVFCSSSFVEFLVKRVKENGLEREISVSPIKKIGVNR
jgi:hypothetical protein